MAEEWRVEIELNDQGHGLSLGERLRSLDLDDEARERLGGDVIVTRDGSRLFLYAASQEAAARGGSRDRGTGRVRRASTARSRSRTGTRATTPGRTSRAPRPPRDEGHPEERAPGVPFLVFLESHKPKILRDFGL